MHHNHNITIFNNTSIVFSSYRLSCLQPVYNTHIIAIICYAVIYASLACNALITLLNDATIFNKKFKSSQSASKFPLRPHSHFPAQISIKSQVKLAATMNIFNRCDFIECRSMDIRVMFESVLDKACSILFCEAM